MYCLGGEATEDDSVHRANPSACQHREYGLRARGHVDCDCVSLADALALECVRELAHLQMEFAVSNEPTLARLISLEDDRRLIRVGIEVTVKTVVRCVETATKIPRDEPCLHVAVAHLESEVTEQESKRARVRDRGESQEVGREFVR